MVLSYLTGHPLAMLPSKVEEIYSFLNDREMGNKINIEGLGGEKLKDSPFNIDNGIATINIFGAISKRMNLMQEMSGGVSVELLERDINALCINDEVKGILLNIDSPGGSVHGIKDIADIISDCKKPIVAYSDGLMASAAYWIASAADHVVVSETSTVGSIGVVTVHTDTSKADEAAGIKNTVLTAGKFKALGNSTEKLGDEGREEIQEKLNQFYSIFVENVAKNRGESVEAILQVADGKTFVGKNAPKELVNLTGSMKIAYNTLVNLIDEGDKMDMKEFKESEEFQAMVKESDDKVMIERQRCLDIMAIEGGHSEVKLSAIKEGVQVNDVYADLYKAELANKKSETDRLSNLTEPVKIDTNAPQKVTKKSSESDYLALVKNNEKEGMKKSEAILKARREAPEGFQAYIENNQ